MPFVRDLAISRIPLAHEAKELLGPGSPCHPLQKVLQGQWQLLLLLAVGPVCPVAEVIGSSHLVGQCLCRGQQQHGESQREPHGRLDVPHACRQHTDVCLLHPYPGGQHLQAESRRKSHSRLRSNAEPELKPSPLIIQVKMNLAEAWINALL